VDLKECVSGILGKDIDSSEFAKYRAGFILAGCAFIGVAVIQIWLFNVLRACHRYLIDKTMAATTLPTVFVQQQQSGQAMPVYHTGPGDAPPPYPQYGQAQYPYPVYAQPTALPASTMPFH